MELKLDIKEHKLTKTLPQVWLTPDRDIPENEMFVLEDFSVYAKKLYASLLGIKKFYQDKFNKNNTYTIDEYLQLFDSAYNKILNVFVPTTQATKIISSDKTLKQKDYNAETRFLLLEKVLQNNNNFKFDENNNLIGFSDETYLKIKNKVKQLFLIEKLCSFTTREFWKEEITSFEDLDLNKPYKILVKCVLKDGWRKEGKSKKLDNFMKSKIFNSTSLIDNKHFYNTFFAFTSQYALLLIDYSDKDYVCASAKDSYSEEVIDNKNLLEFKRVFSDILLQNEINENQQNHKFYAEAVECETPQNILDNIELYTEVNMKHIKPKAVIVPNYDSIDFAKQVAKEYGDLPVIMQYEKK